MSEGKTLEYRLSAIQQRTVLALGRDVERLQMELQETNAALNELAARYAKDFSCPVGAFLFRRKEDGVVVLEVVEEPAPG